MNSHSASALIALALAAILTKPAVGQVDPLPSWNEGVTKKAIVEFVGKVTKQGGSDYVPPAERIAAFDNDGTLWCEHPLYVQIVFAVDRVRAFAAKHPEVKDQPLFKAALGGDIQAVLSVSAYDRLQFLATSHAGMTSDEFTTIVEDWLKTARHPRFKRPYTELVYQPMLELLAYLRANQFKTFIVSGGGVEFMRPWTASVYGIPPEQVVGSSVKLKYELKDGQPTLFRLAEINFVDDKAGKPVGIQQSIGRRPIAAFGNSDGDYEMLRWVTSGPGPRFGLIVHHTDAEREYAYDRKANVGRLVRALDEAPERGWLVMDMKRDWNVVFPRTNP
ncbi:Phosphoserine phosphatase [Singulisphaera sp. GP187]|uniref:HAD family hydrolase n=1 Tax=Singulisphaera sp. GP187 TaxID=1882752 RepID=UPI00092803AF|nr:HAD family hydrolase [Singulisphaera sp. GP187]SIO60460.1 Phosphoserine phosphatase [Singulisphaera sp. GP187]